MNPLKTLRHPLSLYDLAKRWGLSRRKTISKADQHKNKTPAYCALEIIPEVLGSGILYVIGLRINGLLETETNKLGDDKIFFNKEDIIAFESYKSGSDLQDQSYVENDSSFAALERARHSLSRCAPKERKYVEAYIYRVEKGCTVQELADHFNKSKRTAELYLTKAKSLLGRGEP